MHQVHRSQTTADLRAEGFTRASIRREVTRGTIVRARRGLYLSPSAPDEIIRAARVGGRLTCLSLLAMLKVFVLHNARLHVHMAANASRMRSERSRAVRLEARTRRSARLHWQPLFESVPADATCVSILDAIAHSVLCQAPRAAVATLDSALHLGLIAEDDLGDLFRMLPAKYGFLRGLIDARAESGTESLVRLLVRGLGCEVELQVAFRGVGRVDLLIDGWLVIECDSREFHSSWEQQVRDRDRDLALAAQGYTTLRLTPAQIIHRPEDVLLAVKGLLAAH